MLSVDLSLLSGTGVMTLLRSLEQLRRRLDAVGHRVVAEIESRRLAGEYARASTVDLLVTALRVSPGDARARVNRAVDLGPRTTLTGEALPPLMPIAARAVAAGEISSEHVAVIAHCVDHLPPALAPTSVEVVEATLVSAARHEHPGRLRRTAALLLARLDPDGPEPADVARHRELTLLRHADGSGRLRGRLTAEATAVWDTLLDTLSAPVPADDGLPDDRSPGQRRHDGLLEAGYRLLRSGSLPAAGGVPVTVLVRTPASDVATACTAADSTPHARSTDARPSGFESDVSSGGHGLGLSARGDTLDLAALAPALGDAALVPVRLDTDGAVLRLGRTRRLASNVQRLALAARDGGCCFPGCDRPGSWTEVHHVVEWQAGGDTDIDNLCLLCRFHHREFRPRGWMVRMADGLPEWIPPPWVDPTGQPVRNRTHHPPTRARLRRRSVHRRLSPPPSRSDVEGRHTRAGPKPGRTGGRGDQATTWRADQLRCVDRLS